MSGTEEYTYHGFGSLIAKSQSNELQEESRRFEEERRQHAELRKSQNPNSINPTELLGIRTEQELMDNLDTELTKETKAADAAAAAQEKKDTDDVTTQFPAPTITR